MRFLSRSRLTQVLALGTWLTGVSCRVSVSSLIQQQTLQVADDTGTSREIANFLLMSDEEIMEGADHEQSHDAPQIRNCPVPCQENEPNEWTIYSSLDQLFRCQEPLVFDFAIHNDLGPDRPLKFRACSAAQQEFDIPNIPSHTSNPTSSPKEVTRNLEIAEGGSLPSEDIRQEETEVALEVLGDFLSSDELDGHKGIKFGYYQGIFTGGFVGSSLRRASVRPAVKAMVQASRVATSSNLVVQLCDQEGGASNHILGIALTTSQNMTAVQKSLQSWNKGSCAPPGFEYMRDTKITVWETQASDHGARPVKRAEAADGECEYVKVASGDTCGALASKCGISPHDFDELNSDNKDLCSSLMPGQPVCCTKGDVPDLRPKPNDDGTCASYLVQEGDDCSTLAGANGLTVEDIDKFNKGTTWGWYSCDKLMGNVKICLSKGNPPLPQSQRGAQCGPTKPGTKQPPSGVDMIDLNPCPLNSCCNVWGNCGITSDFCAKGKEMDNPGTSELQNGCVSNCGTEIVNQGTQPGIWGRIGYYEAWNFNRPCMNLLASNANTDGSYTKIHWAFAEINPDDWTVKIVAPEGQWEDFKNGGPHKRIISFGGWGYSTEKDTYDILRQAFSEENRETFADNVNQFLEDEGLDGVDFDWEYPGAMDIPGTPPGKKSDGPNYLKFLTIMKQKLSVTRTLSMAVPASYWYLKNFPIAKMASTVNYFVYMTYDLHGQWDAGNSWTQDGCPQGNCLRSHVNLTETVTSLAMITKAGVPTYQIFVGESSYGRSFKMAEEGCTGPMCRYLGDSSHSQATPGRCTETAGYIANGELDEYKVFHDDWRVYHDGESNSDIMIYNKTEWVAFMTNTTKNTRRDHWQFNNFAGTIDWAVDLQTIGEDDLLDPTDDYEWQDEHWPPLEPCKMMLYDTFDELEADMPNQPQHCINGFIIQVLFNELGLALLDYDGLLDGGYDAKFNTYADAVVGAKDTSVQKFMDERGNEFFSCDVTEEVKCCSYCYGEGGLITDDLDNYCRYCEDWDCGYDPDCGDNGTGCNFNIENRYRNITGPCSPDYSLRADPGTPGQSGHQAVYWHLEKEDEFFASLFGDYGIQEDAVSWEDVRLGLCATLDPEDCPHEDWDYNFPVAKWYQRDDVLNPKDTVSKPYDALMDLKWHLWQVYNLARKGIYDNEEEIIDAVAMPVFSIRNAVDQMQNIDDTVDEWNEEKRKATMLAWLTAIFIIVPFAGEAIAGVAALAGVARVLAVLGAMGEVATGIYNLVDSEGGEGGSPVLDIIGLVLAPLAVFDVVTMTRAAKIRRTMGETGDMAKMGKGINDPMKRLEKLRFGGYCSRMRTTRSVAEDIFGIDDESKHMSGGVNTAFSTGSREFHGDMDGFRDEIDRRTKQRWQQMRNITTTTTKTTTGTTTTLVTEEQ